MILNTVKPNVEMSSDDMQAKFFSIEDTGMIFDILRNKMYSDPIRAICREISCNARDTHRVSDKRDLPIEITLPNTFEKFYKIKDFGEGISPDRMENVFIKYTASTKRKDNVQLGGFGIGAKVPLSYTDSFSINTIFDHIKYSYSCFIDETKLGKLVLLHKEATDQDNSTEIVIPVKSQDFYKFAEDTEYVTRHWDVKPIIRGNAFPYKEITPTLKGNGYSICQSNNYNVIREVKLIIDGIEYPLDLNQLKGNKNLDILESINGIVYLYFGVGELSLSATREQVHLDKETQTKISNRLSEIIADFTKDIQKKIDIQPSLWEANVWINTELQKTFSRINFIKNLNWQGHALTMGNLRIQDAHVYCFGKKQTYNKKQTYKVQRWSTGYIEFSKNTAIYLCDLDLPDVQVKNVKQAFEDDTDLKQIYVVSVSDFIISTFLKTPTTPSKVKTLTIDDIEKTNNLNALGAKKLSTITKVSKTYTLSGTRLLVFKFDMAAKGFRQISYADMENDPYEKIICSLVKDYGVRRVTLNKKIMSDVIVQSILDSNKDYSLYGVDEDIPSDKIEKHFSDFTPISDFIDEKIINSKKLDFKFIKYCKDHQYEVMSKDTDPHEMRKSLLKQDSIYCKYLDLMIKIKSMLKYIPDLNIYEYIKGEIPYNETVDWITNNPKLILEKAKDEVNLAYPLLEYINDYRLSYNKDPIIHYINLVDKEQSVI